MRIIAGRFRHRTIDAAPGDTTRPITDRAKVQLFDRLGSFDGQRVIDVFAGTGTLGLEALSRGAGHVVFVERDRKAFELLGRNVATLRVEDEVFLWRADVLRCSFRPKGRDDLGGYDRIFFDPPYPVARDVRPGAALYKALARLGRAGVAAEDAELILRLPERASFAVPPVWELSSGMSVSGMDIRFYRRSDAAVSADDAPDEADTSDEPG